MNTSSISNFEYECDITENCPFNFQCNDCFWDCGEDHD